MLTTKIFQPRTVAKRKQRELDELEHMLYEAERNAQWQACRIAYMRSRREQMAAELAVTETK